MTPKLRLREHARKTLLSSMRKLRLPGNRRTIVSTQMIAAPKTQAVQCQHSGLWAYKRQRGLPTPLTMHMIHPLVSLSRARAVNSMVTGKVTIHRGLRAPRNMYEGAGHDHALGVVTGRFRG